MTARRRRISFFVFNRFVTPLSCELFFFLEISLSPHFFIFVAAVRAGRLYTRVAYSIRITERNGVSLALLFSFESEDVVQILFFLRDAVGILLLLLGKDKKGG